tara:strand:+ start:858 stop:1568 length:711 start_codon:yes stop_codon:yes gene_type:complete
MNRINTNRLIYKKEKKKVYFQKLNFKIKKKNFSLIDLGCASGGFIDYLNKIKKNENNYFLGVEKEIFLLKMQTPKKLMKLKNVQLINRDFTKKNFKIEKKFDYVTCLGTINLFNEIESIFRTIFKLCKKNGKIFIYDIFNDDPINIRTSVNFDNDNNKKWSNHFNCYSQSHVKKICKRINPKSNILFQELNFTNIKVKKKKFPSLNSYTKKIDKKTYFISPFKQILPFKILEITNN